MKQGAGFLKTVLILIVIVFLNSCTKNEFIPPYSNSFLKKVVSDGYVIQQYTYNHNNLIEEENGVLFYKKFTYNENDKLIREESAISSDLLNSFAPASATHEFLDPNKVKSHMVYVYQYDAKGNLSRQLNYSSEEGKSELRSARTFEYDEKNRITKVLLRDSNDIVTQFLTFLYDNNGNVKEENYFSYLFITDGSGPKPIRKTIYEYDSFYNPFAIFKQTADPGIFTNPNNIVRRSSYNYDEIPGIDNYSETVTVYEYNFETGYPVRIKGGEKYVY